MGCDEDVCSVHCVMVRVAVKVIPLLDQSTVVLQVVLVDLKRDMPYKDC